MKTRAIILVAAALFDCRAAIAQSAEEGIALSERVYVASKIYASMEMYFAHRTGVPGLDLEAAYKTYLERVLAATVRRDFALATLEFIAGFRNKHTQFDDQWLRRKHGQSLGFGVSQADGKWVVASTDNGSLRKGDVIRSIDGIDIEIFVRDKEKFISASSERAARSLVFERPYLFPETFTLGLEDGRQIAIQRGVPKKAASHESRSSAPEGRWLVESSVGYIRIPSFGDPGYERTALEFAKKFHDAGALIVDVRGNGGGRTPYGLIRELMDREWRSWITTTPLHHARDRARGSRPAEVRFETGVTRPETNSFRGKLILLVDRFTCSACEDFVMPFKDNGRAEILGETTEGSSGQPYFFDFGNGMTLMVGAERHSFPDGSPFETVGITPTIPVERHVADIRSGVDPVLEKAKEIARGR
jgi:carboxyl-terminal processing protease